MHQSSQTLWLETTLGQYLLQHEQQIYDTSVFDIFGFNAVQVGFSKVDFLKNTRIPNVLHVDQQAGDLHCQSDYLPFEESCIDLLCLPHALEFSDNPHQTLREAARVLVPEGHLLLTGFNPISAWGLRYWLNKESLYPWHGQFFTVARIKDWLALLGLEFLSIKFCCYYPPINDEKWSARLQFMDQWGEKWWPMMGGIYFIVAKKRVVNMTLLKPKWKSKALARGLAVGAHKKTTTIKKDRTLKVNNNNDG